MAPRAKKEVEENIESVSETTIVTEDSTKSIEKENKELRSELDMLKGMIAMLSQQMQAVKENSDTTKETVDNMDIPDNKLVKVISLRPHKLNLSTGGFGKGTVYDFREFGQVQSIQAGHLKLIIKNEKGLHKKGAFYILDEEFVQKNGGVSTTQQGILTAEQITNLVNMEINDIDEIFKVATDMQKETIVSLIIERASNGETIDYNKIKAMSKYYSKDIIAMIDAVQNPVEQS